MAGLLGRLKVRCSEESGILEFMISRWLVKQYRNDNDSQLKVKYPFQTFFPWGHLAKSVFWLGDKANFAQPGLLRQGHRLGNALVPHSLVSANMKLGLGI